jgi:hypothetical protein
MNEEEGHEFPSAEIAYGCGIVRTPGISVNAGGARSRTGATELSQDDRTALQHATLPWLIVTADELVGYAPSSAAPMAIAVAQRHH